MTMIQDDRQDLLMAVQGKLNDLEVGVVPLLFASKNLESVEKEVVEKDDKRLNALANENRKLQMKIEEQKKELEKEYDNNRDLQTIIEAQKAELEEKDALLSSLQHEKDHLVDHDNNSYGNGNVKGSGANDGVDGDGVNKKHGQEATEEDFVDLRIMVDVIDDHDGNGSGNGSGGNDGVDGDGLNEEHGQKATEEDHDNDPEVHNKLWRGQPIRIRYKYIYTYKNSVEYRELVEQRERTIKIRGTESISWLRTCTTPNCYNFKTTIRMHCGGCKS